MSKGDVTSRFAHVALAEQVYNDTVRDLRESLQRLIKDPDLSDGEKRLVRIAWSGVRYANAIARHGVDDEVARRIHDELRTNVRMFYYPPGGRVPKAQR